MIVIYVDILLLVILLVLIVFMCGYTFYRINRLRQNGEIPILLKPTKVVFSHKKEGQSTEELRTVVAYQNPFTGDYCIHKSRLNANGYINNIVPPDSPDSGVSDEYEPLNLEPIPDQPSLPRVTVDGVPQPQKDNHMKIRISPEHEDYSVNKTWNWHYKEYQI